MKFMNELKILKLYKIDINTQSRFAVYKSKQIPNSNITRRGYPSSITKSYNINQDDLSKYDYDDDDDDGWTTVPSKRKKLEEKLVLKKMGFFTT